MKVSMLTTVDNPYDPFDEFEQWFLYDVHNGYNSCGILDRVSNVNDAMTEKEIDTEIERAIDAIIKYDFMNVYKKVTKDLDEVEFVESPENITEGGRGS